jgi:hypothetical protein
LVLILLASVAGAANVVLVWPGEKEPVYKEKRLSEWLEIYRMNLHEGTVFEENRDNAEDAVCKIGTNAVPFLLHWVNYNLPEWRQKGAWAAEKMPWPRISVFLQRQILGGGELRAEWGLAGFRILGPVASGAITELSRQVNMGSEGGKRSAMALAWVGGEGIVALVGVLTNSQARDRDNVLQVVRAFAPGAGTNAATAVPILIECLQSSNPGMANMAAEVLGLLVADPDRSVPALTNALIHGADFVRPMAACSLGEFRSRARSAVPALTVALEDRDVHVRYAVTNVLRRIAPEVLWEREEKAGAGTDETND